MVSQELSLVVTAIALYVAWRWVKNRERQDIDEHDTYQSAVEVTRGPIGFHKPTVSE